MNIGMSGKINNWDTLRAATINGARALKMEDKTGSVMEGKSADIVLLSTDELGMSPLRENNLVPLLIYSGNTQNVKYVLSGGRLLVNNGKLVNADEHRLAAELSRIAATVDARAKSGKTWAENIELTPQTLKTYLYRYRSVRKPDSVHITVTNRLSRPAKLTIACSGAVFGGGLPAVVSSSVSDYFPLVRQR